MAIFKPGYAMPESILDCAGVYDIHRPQPTTETQSIAGFKAHGQTLLGALTWRTFAAAKIYRREILPMANSNVQSSTSCTVYRTIISYGTLKRVIYWPAIMPDDMPVSKQGDLRTQILGVWLEAHQIMHSNNVPAFSSEQTSWLKIMPHMLWIDAEMRDNIHTIQRQQRGVTNIPLSHAMPDNIAQTVFAEADRAMAAIHAQQITADQYFNAGLSPLFAANNLHGCTNGIIHAAKPEQCVNIDPKTGKEPSSALEFAMLSAQQMLDTLAFLYCRSFDDTKTPNTRLMDSIFWEELDFTQQKQQNHNRCKKTNKILPYSRGLCEPMGRVRTALNLTDLDMTLAAQFARDEDYITQTTGPRQAICTCMLNHTSDKQCFGVCLNKNADSAGWPSPLINHTNRLTQYKAPLYNAYARTYIKLEKAKAQALYKYAVYATVLSFMNHKIVTENLRTVTV